MRIISGQAKGRKLKSLKGQETRPTSDRVKEALFSILALDILDANFLDLFAGTGSIGMEAISRGAKTAVFVELRNSAVNVIRDNLHLCGFSFQGTVIRSDALVFLKKTALSNRLFDLIYVDPPYDCDLVGKSLELIAAGNILSESGKVIVEARKGSPQADVSVIGLQMIRQAVYGDTVLIFYRKAEAPKGD